MTQLALFPRTDTDARFRAFHEANPHVYARLVELAREARRAGVERLGMRMLWERLRWDARLRTVRGEDEWKLNNDLAPSFARMLMSREPDLRGLFETRERT